MTRSLDVINPEAHCPLLASAYQEVLRKVTIGTFIREVVQDTILRSQWLLKKDVLIQMPSGVIRSDHSVRGSDVDEFNPRRFIKDETPKIDSGKRPNPAAFRAFEAGRHCFATIEVLTVVTMFIIRYNMALSTGSWSTLTINTERTKQSAIILEPDHGIEVEVSVRNEYKKGRWAFSLKNSGIIYALATEDLY